jgi:hypothetical protein
MVWGFVTINVCSTQKLALKSKKKVKESMKISSKIG